MDIVNRTSSTGSQRGYVSDVGDALHGVHVVDFQKECVLPPTDTIQCHGGDFFALTPTQCRKVSGEPSGIQFALSDGKSHLRRGAFAMK